LGYFTQSKEGYVWEDNFKSITGLLKQWVARLPWNSDLYVAIAVQ
jgi:hypothetical protein